MPDGNLLHSYCGGGVTKKQGQILKLLPAAICFHDTKELLSTLRSLAVYFSYWQVQHAQLSSGIQI